MMQILGLLGMYFDAAVVFVTNSSLLFRLAMAILCRNKLKKHSVTWPFTVWINCSSDLCKFSSAFSLEFQKFFSITRTIFSPSSWEQFCSQNTISQNSKNNFRKNKHKKLTSLGSSGAGGIGISRRLLCKKISSRLRLIFKESSSGISNASLSNSRACSSFLA